MWCEYISTSVYPDIWGGKKCIANFCNKKTHQSIKSTEERLKQNVTNLKYFFFFTIIQYISSSECFQIHVYKSRNRNLIYLGKIYKCMESF